MSDQTGFGMAPKYLAGRVTVYELAVYVALTWHADQNGVSWPSHRRLAEQVQASPSTVVRALNGLRDKGFVTWEQRLDERGQQSNRYVLMVPPPPTTTDTPPTTTDTPPMSQDVTPKSQGQSPPVSVTDPLCHRDRRTRLNEQDSMNKTQELDPMNKNVTPPDVGVTSDEPTRLAAFLAARIHNNGSKKPQVTKAWITSIDRMHRLDGRTWDEIEGAIRWSQSHDFWATVVLSPQKLRSNFDQMRLQAKREQQRAGPGGQTTADILAMADRL